MTLPAKLGPTQEIKALAPHGPGLGTFGVIALIVTALYVGRDVFVPVALAILFSFVLAPLVKVLRRLKIPRSLAVITIVVVAFAGVSALAMMMATQATQLASDLPRYQNTIREKISSLRGSGSGGGVLSRAADVLQELGKELDRAPEQPVPEAFGAPKAPPEQRPIPVEVHQPNPGALQTLRAFLVPLIHPLATTGIVVIFVIFILLQREDLRNRFIRLTGAYDLQKTTAAFDDAASRLSRLFLTQLAVNAGFGLVIGLGLWAIGVPSPALWGILTAVLRFIPYIGAIFSAAFPLTIAAAVDPGWTMLLWTAALFLIAEPVAGHVIEPLVYGQSTGMSPVAIVVAATFWTWLWGPIGLVLATPLTVCLVVLGRHVERLEFLDVLLGDRPALSAPEIFYQRILAGDPAEAADKAEQVLKERSLSAYYETVAVEGLRLASADALRGVLDDARMVGLLEAVREVVDDLADHDDMKPQNGKTPTDAETEATVIETNEMQGTADLQVLAPEDLAETYRTPQPVLFIAGQNQLDEAIAVMLAQVVEKHGVSTRIEPSNSLSTRNIFTLSTDGVALVCLCYLNGNSIANMRYAVKRLRRKMPAATIVIVVLTLAPNETGDQLMDAAKPDRVAVTFREAVRFCLEDATACSAPPVRTPQVLESARQT
ncbi:AI-2E family transporter [Bosea psychrotolerans]|uniref:Putative PurR-regulated permease PerM n=1 Tax=Bosea psychrotolerans TaxID=1871628 RepID=A0A2S4MCG4_9HYPH|nr:AI-2E family transporter [Bosea psychrotolerans]POR52426.1 putative PurR-regulated permease PerM [Bosea psychrotolerans]